MLPIISRRREVKTNRRGVGLRRASDGRDRHELVPTTAAAALHVSVAAYRRYHRRCRRRERERDFRPPKSLFDNGRLCSKHINARPLPSSTVNPPSEEIAKVITTKSSSARADI